MFRLKHTGLSGRLAQLDNQTQSRQSGDSIENDILDICRTGCYGRASSWRRVCQSEEWRSGVRGHEEASICLQACCEDDVKHAIDRTIEIVIAVRLRTEPIAAQLKAISPMQVRKRGVM
jgi:hypothetical protein